MQTAPSPRTPSCDADVTGYAALLFDLGVAAGDAAVFEDALSGVRAGRAGGFGLVVGVDRGGAGEALLSSGADVVCGDLRRLWPGA